MTEEEMDEQLELMKAYDSWREDDRCYERTGYGDDYSENEYGESVCNCDDCPWNSTNNDEQRVNDMSETFYKPLTPDMRRQIDDSISKNIAELKTCEQNDLVKLQIYGQQALKDLIRSLPDGYLIPMKK